MFKSLLIKDIVEYRVNYLITYILIFIETFYICNRLGQKKFTKFT
jgi:hypothetical protein